MKKLFVLKTQFIARLGDNDDDNNNNRQAIFH